MSRTMDIAKLIGSVVNIANGTSADYEKNIHYGSSAPSNPVSGQLWVDTTNAGTHLMKAYNGTTWINVGSAAATESGFNTFFGAY